MSLIGSISHTEKSDASLVLHVQNNNNSHLAISAKLALTVALAISVTSFINNATVAAQPSKMVATPVKSVGPAKATAAEIRFNKALALKNKNHYDEAILAFARIIQDEPNNVPAIWLHGVCLYCTGEEEKAIADFTKAITINPKFAEAYSSRAKSYSVLGKGDLAKADIAKAIKLQPLNANIYALAGYIYASLNQFSEAISLYSKAIELEPKTFLFRHNRAMAYTSSGDLNKALADYAFCINKEPLDEEAYFCSAHIFEKQGAYAKAAEQYRQLCKVKPKQLDNIGRLANALVKAKLYDEALVHCNKLLALSPDDDELFVLRARCFLGKNNARKALDDLNKAIALTGKGSKEIYCLRSSAHKALGEYILVKEDETQLRSLDKL